MNRNFSAISTNRGRSPFNMKRGRKLLEEERPATRPQNPLSHHGKSRAYLVHNHAHYTSEKRGFLGHTLRSSLCLRSQISCRRRGEEGGAKRRGRRREGSLAYLGPWSSSSAGDGGLPGTGKGRHPDPSSALLPPPPPFPPCLPHPFLPLPLLPDHLLP